jgi:FMN phosphatase YigB (HAD superfamily)
VPTLSAVFFDIGGTLGDRDPSGRLVPFDDSVALLRAMRDTLGLKVGVITNLPASMSDDQLRQLLTDAGLLPFLDPRGVVTNHSAGVDKPDPHIYRFAAGQLSVPVEQCLFIGEDPDEVQAALDVGMSALRKASF